MTWKGLKELQLVGAVLIYEWSTVDLVPFVKYDFFHIYFAFRYFFLLLYQKLGFQRREDVS